MQITLNDTVHVACTKLDGISVEVDLTRLTPEYITLLLIHGLKQKANDKLSSKSLDDYSEDDIEHMFRASVAELQNMTAKFGSGGGRRLDNLTKAIRQVIEVRAKKKSIKSEEIADLIKTPRATVRAWAEKAGVEFDKAWAQIMAEATPIAKALDAAGDTETEF